MKRIGEQKSLMDNLSRRIQELDACAKQRLLSMDEWNERIEVEKNLENLLILKNLQWKQKAGRSWVLHGDANTNFFHQYASGRRRKNTISYL
jgi:ABC-type molybdenum transport system ATPase subunit/photorepair protein PhrA